MASPLDIGAAVMGAAGLAMQVFQGCLEGYRILHDAQQVGNEGDLLRIKLRIQQTRLQDWGRAATIESTQPNERLHWPLIKDILEHQYGILTASEAVRKYYGLDRVDVAADDVGDMEETGASQAESKLKSTPSGLGRILATVRPDLYTESAGGIYARNKPLKRIRWALVGSKTLNKIVNDLNELNNGLAQLLEPTQQARTWNALEALYRDLLSRSSTIADVDTLAKIAGYVAKDNSKSLQAAAEFKKIRLLLAWDKREDEVQPTEQPLAYQLRINKRLRNSKLDMIHVQKKEGLILARYGDADVLIEWRRVPAGLFKVYRPYMEDLAFLLGNASTTFAALTCFGHVVFESESLWGYVYEIPEALTRRPSGAGIIAKSLKQLMQEARHVPLKLRNDTAIVISKAMLELHAAGWLHKGIRADKVIFVNEEGSSSRQIVTQRPYLVGYDAARPDSKYGAALSEMADLSLEDQLYHHPDRVTGASASNKPFRKLYDLYSLGCLLVEIALWKPLVAVYEEVSGNKWQARIQEAGLSNLPVDLPSLTDFVKMPGFCDAVEHSVGSGYLEAIKLCVGEAKVGQEDAELGVELEKHILARLQHRADEGLFWESKESFEELK